MKRIARLIRVRFIQLLGVTALLGVSPAVFPASFDCAKAGTSIEKMICQGSLLNELDEALAKNFAYLLKSSSNEAARKELRDEQKAWIAQRNKCTDAGCVAGAYVDRLEQMCPRTARYGKDPNCIGPEDIPALATKSAPNPATQTPQAKSQSQGGDPKGGSNQALENAKSKFSAQIRSLGFSKSELTTTVYLQYDMVNSPRPFLKFEDVVALIYNNQRVTSITKLEYRKSKGISIKTRGNKPGGLLFRFMDGEALLSHVVDSDGDAESIDSTGELYAASALIISMINEGLEQGTR